MSCSRDAEHCNRVAGAHGVPESVAVWAAGRGAGGHCERCGGFLTTEGVCNNPRCGMLTMTSRENDALKEGASLMQFLESSGIDPLNNESVRRLHENYVSIVTGTKRIVIMDTSIGTAATDMRGKVFLNPYPLGKDGAVIDQLIVTREYIDHELGHELFTPVNLLNTTIAIAKGTSSFSPYGKDAKRWHQIWKSAGDLSPAERKLLHPMVNVIEDARMERVVEIREPYMWKQMVAGQLLQPKDAHARNGGLKDLSDHEQVLWAAQIVGQSNYALTPDIQAGMSDRALQTIRDLMPVIDRGVRGTAYDALESSIAIVREIKKRGMLADATLKRNVPEGFSGSQEADGEVAAGEDSPPAGGAGSSGGGTDGKRQDGGAGSSGGGTSSEHCPKCGAYLDKDGNCHNCGGATGKSDNTADHNGLNTSAFSGNGGHPGGGTTKDTVGTGEPQPDVRNNLTTAAEQERVRKAWDEAGKDLNEMRDAMVGQYKKAVKRLITNAEKHLAKRLAAPPGQPPKTITLPMFNNEGAILSRPYKLFSHHALLSNKVYKAELVENNRDRINRGATKMAARLKKMKQRVQRDAYMQKHGALDRQRFVAAAKGSNRVRMQQADRHDLSMAVSMSFDISGSMFRYESQLGTIAGIIGRGLEKAQIPYEFRAYNVDQYHIKAFEHKKISDEQVGSLYTALGNNCDAPSIAMGGYALQTRSEAAKVQFVLTDGQPQSFVDQSYGKQAIDEVKNAVQANKEKGVLTLGIFFAGSSGVGKERITPIFDYMYGKGNWVYIPELKDVPDTVTKTLEKQLARYLPDFS